MVAKAEIMHLGFQSKPRPFLVRSVVHWSHQRRFHLESETTWAIFFLPSFQQAFRQLAFRGVRSPINSREFASTKRKKIEDVRGFSFGLKPDILTYWYKKQQQQQR
ncbi:hypothetical protein V1478_014157 [Vespula squamosa]|uniref:Uncharacterized protein n=1 Tax=Vespula squamosa TaxID=30214 RepID=A0ABD2A7X1_VESSQ